MKKKTYDNGIVKRGLGRLRLTGNDTYSGDTQVLEGELAVDGSLVSAVSVEQSATQSGSGKIGALLARSGSVISPGNHSIGTLGISRDAIFEKGSLFVIEIAPNGHHDLLVIDGKVMLGGIILPKLTETQHRLPPPKH